MKFRSAYDYGVERFCSPSGSRYRKEYTREFASDGSSKLVETGVLDVYDSIQKAAQGCKLEDLIRRARAGDSSALGTPVKGQDIDITGMPNDLLEAHQMLNSAKNKFYQLTADQRALFGNSFDTFLKSSVDGTLISKLAGSSSHSSGVQPLTSEELKKVRDVIGGTSNA